MRCLPLTLLLPVVLAAAVASAAAQDKAPAAYPNRDILSPFRRCDEIYAPPDAVYKQLRIMRDLADDASTAKDFDALGREVVDHPRWKDAYAALKGLVLDAGYLAEIMRKSRNADERDLAFYGTFFCGDPSNVFNLIGHIPGEPERRTREKAYPRAVAYVRAHIGMKYGDLSDEQKKAIELPEIGSPAAKAMGLTRAPEAGDFLFHLNLTPYLQLLDLDGADDQAQGLWFLKECFLARKDLAKAWLEPALPRVQQLLVTGKEKVREQAIGLYLAIAPKDTKPAGANEDGSKLAAWAEPISRAMFPPIRQLGDGVVLLLPGEDRQKLAALGRQELQSDRVGSKGKAVLADGSTVYGFRVLTVPAGLEVLRMPADALITAVNGSPVNDAASLLAAIEKQFVIPKDKKGKDLPRRQTVIVEFVLGDKSKAIEYRVP